MSIEKDPNTGEIIWPVAVLKQARESVIASRYAPGAEQMIRDGKCDHWHAIHVACHAITGFIDEEPQRAIQQINPRERKVDISDRIRLIEQEMNERMSERESELREQQKQLKRTLSAKKQRLNL